MSTQIQWRRGTTAGHSTFTGAVGEITVDTDKDTIVVHDGTTAGGHPLAKTTANTFTAQQSFTGTAATAPAIAGASDPNTGVFFPAADTVAVSTGGSEKMRIDTSGNVGVACTASGAKFHSQITAGSTTAAVGKFEAAIGGYTGDSILATNSLSPASTYNLLRCLSDSDGDAGGPFTAFKVDGNGLATVNTATGGLGYGTGAGGTVTQATSRATAVTINKPTGAITMFTAAGSGTWSSFVVNNSLVAATDTVVLAVKTGASNTYVLGVSEIGALAFRIAFAAVSGTASDAPVINFAIIKGVTS